ncbi:MAG: ABC transporter ATP-binding protein [Clostridia bacterium]|nr:ABC transporter ATP-binding protein [Clostridia bacterium]
MFRILKMIKPHRKTLLLSILFSTLYTIMQVLLPFYTRRIYSEGIVVYNMDKIVEIGGGMLLLTLLSIALSFSNTYFSTRTSVEYSRTLRNAMFDKVSHLCQSDIDKIGVSSLITRTTNDVKQVHDVILNILKSLLPVPIMLIGGLVMAFTLSKDLASASMSFLPVMVIFAVALLIIIIPMYSKMQKKLDELNQLMREKIGGIRVIRAFNKTQQEDARFEKTNYELTGLALRASRIMSSMLPFITVALYGLLCILMYIAVRNADALDPVTQETELLNTIPNLQMFLSFFSMIFSSIASVVGIVVSIPRASISAKRINEVYDSVTDVPESENPVSPKEELRGVVEFRNVSFRYKPVPKEKSKKKKNKPSKKTETEEQKPLELDENKKKKNTDRDAVHNISFTCRPGEMTAIIGITGSGKSTLVNLIPRLYDATQGEVLIGGVNVRDISTKDLNSRIALIPQQAFLFSGTVADNIRFGKEDASDTEIWKALEIAQAKSFVAAMPEGIESFVSQAGKNYSGGQKQRLSIARAIVKNADICIFDDSFSALDLATDARLRAALRENMQDTNIIIVTQRVGTVLNADRIVVMDNGEAVGIGTHEELLQSCDIYKEIVASQLEDASDEEVGA